MHPLCLLALRNRCRACSLSPCGLTSGPRRPGRVWPGGLAWLAALLLIGFATGCSRQPEAPAPSEPAEAATATAPEAAAAPETAATVDTTPPTFEVTAEELLAARLPLEETRQGWVRLFDGHTFFGWEIAAPANWRIDAGAITVDSGEVGLLCTSVPWQNFELRLEIKAGTDTNSGIFLRTPLEPTDPESDCYEVNIAPPDNPFPTGGVVKRQPPTATPTLAPDAWHLYEISLVDDTLTVRINGERVCQYTDPNPLPAGRIGLQHNSGAVAFRDIRVRPIGLSPLLDAELSQWKQYPEMEGEFRIEDEGRLRVTGGRGQLESHASFGDFVLLSECKTASEKLNSGIFFRCIPGEVMNGYECQISNESVGGNPLEPADTGTGGIFRRQNARIVAAEDGEWFTMLLVAHGPTVAAWVNGLPVTDWTDTRPPHANPRQGLRLEPGTLMIQAHDPTTDLVFQRLDIVPITQQQPPAETP